MANKNNSRAATKTAVNLLQKVTEAKILEAQLVDLTGIPSDMINRFYNGYFIKREYVNKIHRALAKYLMKPGESGEAVELEVFKRIKAKVEVLRLVSEEDLRALENVIEAYISKHFDKFKGGNKSFPSSNGSPAQPTITSENIPYP